MKEFFQNLDPEERLALKFLAALLAVLVVVAFANL